MHDDNDNGYLFRVEQYNPILRKSKAPFYADGWHKLAQWYTSDKPVAASTEYELRGHPMLNESTGKYNVVKEGPHVGYSAFGIPDFEHSLYDVAQVKQYADNNKKDLNTLYNKLKYDVGNEYAPYYKTTLSDTDIKDKDFFTGKGIVSMLEGLTTMSNHMDKSRIFILKSPKSSIIKAADALNGTYSTQRDAPSEFVTKDMQLSEVLPSDIIKQYASFKDAHNFDPWQDIAYPENIRRDNYINTANWFYDYISKYISPKKITSDATMKNIIARYANECNKHENIVNAVNRRY